ncbi:FAD-dependent oxidoreductase [Microbacterium protaetiae]|uniref:FAD-dependent oxidoreductase n=1 Tax=Microbacterium protaetiae TaxID=2509458 RepID=A0A4P6EB65_9MICO|nr:FAD-dependent oxidoreductase [Microbacterium protaetiae]QAY59400.1 FAD-dependent oxidoreductase [Microbacterium protaetiae]
MTHVVVIGGGAAGLVAAREAAASGADVTVLEAKPTFGGSVAAHAVAGLTLDAGAESFATRGGAVAALIGELGLSDRIVWPHIAGSWLHLPDRTVPAPKGGMLGIPTDPHSPEVVAAIGQDAANRAARDLDEPLRGVPDTLGELVRARMGQAVLDRLVSPVTNGVYSTPADELAVDAIAPGLRAALDRTGSLARAVRELRGGAVAKPGAAAGGLRGGMWTLMSALADDVAARGGRVLVDAPVRGIRREGGTWLVDVAVAARAGTAASPASPSLKQGNPVQTQGDALGLGKNPLSRHPGGGPGAVQSAAGGGPGPVHSAAGGGPGPVQSAAGVWAETLRADAVIVATAQSAAVRLLSGAIPAADWPVPTRVDLATLVLDAPELDAAPRGTGLLVADDAHELVEAKALTHASIKWDWVAEQAGRGRHVVRLSYGQAGHRSRAADVDDAALHALAVQDAATLLGTPLETPQVVGFARSTWTNAVSLATRGQAGRVAAVRDAVAAVPGLEVTGAWVAGTGLASVVPDARAAASRLASR